MNQQDVLLGCRHTPLGLLLEGVQDVYNISKLDGIHGSVSISSMVCNHFECPSARETAQRLAVVVFTAFLGEIRGITHDLLVTASGNRLTSSKLLPIQKSFFKSLSFTH